MYFSVLKANVYKCFITLLRAYPKDFFKEIITDSDKWILLTTHYMHEVEELCDYIYILHKGQLIHEGTPAEIVKLHGNDENSILEQAIIKISKTLGK